MTDQTTGTTSPEMENFLRQKKYKLAEIKDLNLGSGGKVAENFIAIYSKGPEIEKIKKFISSAYGKLKGAEEQEALRQFTNDLEKTVEFAKVVLSIGILKSTEIEQSDFVAEMLNKFDLNCFSRLVKNGDFLVGSYYEGKENTNSLFLKEFGISSGLSNITGRGMQWLLKYRLILNELESELKKIENHSGVKDPNVQKVVQIREKFILLAEKSNEKAGKINDVTLNRENVSKIKKKVMIKQGILARLGLSRSFRVSNTEKLMLALKSLFKDVERFVAIPGNIRSQENLEHVDRSIQYCVEAIGNKVSFNLSKIIRGEEKNVSLKRFGQLSIALKKILKLREQLKLHEKIPNKEIDAIITNIKENLNLTLENMKLKSHSSSKLSQLSAAIKEFDEQLAVVKEVKNMMAVNTEKTAVASPEAKQIKTSEGTDLAGLNRLNEGYRQASRHDKKDPSYIKEMKKLLEETEKEIKTNPKAAVSLNQFKSLLLRDCPELKPKVPERPAVKVSQRNDQKINASVQKEQATVSRGPLPNIPRGPLKAS